MGDVRRSAETRFLPLLAKEDDGGFLADPFSVSPDITVEDQIAENKNPWSAKAFNNVHQVV
jgi:hypothetical protein